MDNNGSGGSKSARRSCSWSDSWSVVAVGLLGGRVVGFFWIAGLMDRGIEGAKENNIGGSTDEAKKEQHIIQQRLKIDLWGTEMGPK